MASWLGHLTPDRVVRVQALAGSLCCVPRQDTSLSQCFSSPRYTNGYQQNVLGVTLQ